MGLSAADKERVRSDWAKVVPDVLAHGIGFYQKLMRENPHYQSKFKFVGVAVEDFPGNVEVQKQARNVTGAVNKCVGWMDAPEDMKKRMAMLAGTHKGYGIDMKDFDVAFGVLLGYLAATLGMDDSGVSSWKNFVAEVRAALASNYNSPEHQILNTQCEGSFGA